MSLAKQDIRINTDEIPESVKVTLAAKTAKLIFELLQQPGGREAIEQQKKKMQAVR